MPGEPPPAFNHLTAKKIKFITAVYGRNWLFSNIKSVIIYPFSDE
ncbi:hypothetical protein yrohd0001_16050 [Yersinia rohdei ATCC 43380]|nr:hypothetical protein yrohd0001_16050 [Yersinia rohdei ATCC 43380]